MKHQSSSKQADQEHNCPICNESITISDVFHRERCPGCESTLEQMQEASGPNHD